MSFLKNKFIIVVILAIVAGGIVGLYLSTANKTHAPAQEVSSGSGASPEKVGEIMGKLNDIAKD